MKLSTSVSGLKRQAKLLARETKVPLHQALATIVAREGFNSWSLLAARASNEQPANTLSSRLQPGDLVLLGAWLGQGKTLLGLELVVEAITSGNTGIFFTLEYNKTDVMKLLQLICSKAKISTEILRKDDLLDTSDAICADYIIDRLKASPQGTLVLIDYLQLLDQRRQNPPLATQVSALKRFAEAKGIIIVFLSQIDRSYELLDKTMPDVTDVRLPNPLDMNLFSKTCFLDSGETRIEAAS